MLLIPFFKPVTTVLIIGAGFRNMVLSSSFLVDFKASVTKSESLRVNGQLMAQLERCVRPA
jgi:hypothetical protein